MAGGASVEIRLTVGGTGVSVGDGIRMRGAAGGGVNVADGVNTVRLAGLQLASSITVITGNDKRTTFLHIFANSRSTD